MRILVLAPQPFYQERGTPIAVKLAVETLARSVAPPTNGSPNIDVLTYSEGEDISIPGARLFRSWSPHLISNVRPGISFKKLLHDVFFFLSTLKLLINQRHQQYTIIHAVEESVFIAWLVKNVWGIPYIYDMDSSLALQLTERWRWASVFSPLLKALEGLAIKGSIAVAPVCQALEDIAKRNGSRHTVLLRDISLLPTGPAATADKTVLGEKIKKTSTIILYVGNLEPYQGIDLLIESFAKIKNHSSQPHLVIIGGTSESISKYSAMVRALDCDDKVSFLGPRPVSELQQYLAHADIVVSPRTQGNNTPMKIYSYLHSGKVLVATDLATHRQVLDESIAVLVPATPEGFSDGLASILGNPTLRSEIGTRAQEVASRLYTAQAFEAQVISLYNAVRAELHTYTTTDIPAASLNE